MANYLEYSRNHLEYCVCRVSVIFQVWINTNGYLNFEWELLRATNVRMQVASAQR